MAFTAADRAEIYSDSPHKTHKALQDATNRKAAEKSKALVDARKISENFSTFLTMTIAQYKHQDPLNPMETDKLAQQFSSMATVGQAIRQNENLEEMLKLMQGKYRENLTGYLGKVVEAEGNIMDLRKVGTEGEEGGVYEATLAYEVPDNIKSVKFQIINDDGAVVQMLPGINTQGRHELKWDGKMMNQGQADQSIYSVQVVAKNNDDEPASVKTYSRVKVDGIDAAGENQKLYSMGYEIPRSKVVRLLEPETLKAIH